MNSEERLDLFGDMILCCHSLYLWHYDAEMKLLKSNCPDEDLVRGLFDTDGTRENLLRQAERYTRPVIMTGSGGILWVFAPEKEDGALRGAHALGPFFMDTARDVERALDRLSLPAPIRRRAADFLRTLPVISLNRVFEYAIMLYFCLSGERIGVSDLHYRAGAEDVTGASVSEQSARVHGTYAMEQEMVRMVREGDLHYREHMDRLAVTGNQGRLSNGEPSRQMKNAVLVCAILFSRAAIEGGVTPETAMTLTDRYFQSVEACRDLAELTELSQTMQEDFVRRVHRAKTSRLSQEIAACRDYIGLHLEEDFTLRELAEKVNYSETHLGRRFKAELGMSFKNYVRAQRLALAKSLLRDPSVSVQEISERLRFCTPSYFAEQFRAQFSVSPSQWREAGDRS
ncbi:MAG: helix-turn-helix domain-containing protein [Clostridia bacterium]|nr:helix-turn-helix domain-containing protein [Clostridia bacterium]